MFDEIANLGRSKIQYGKYNDRIYLMKLDPTDLHGIVDDLRAMAEEHGFSKIFAKVPARSRAPFDEAGYREEALVPGMYGGRDDAVFLSFYLDERRAVEKEPERVQEILAIARGKAGRTGKADDISIEEARPENVREMASVYDAVFPSYPFPIHVPDYLLATMKSHVRYFCVRDDGRIVALSSAEMEPASACVEMTDFATLPRARGRSLATHLLARMEEAMRDQGDMRTAYTIARSLSTGMNVTFARAGYTYAGTLTNNTNISGHIESMNVWYKPL